MLHNQFSGSGRWNIPIIPKFQEQPGDFDNLLLIGFDKTHLEDQNHLDRMVHFFLYDYRFERVWKTPDADLEKLSRYRAVLSPDFSMYLEMAPVLQLYNVFRNRWYGAYWASKGMRVIPTVNWGDESTFDFCFEGIEKGSVVAVSTYMASENGNRQGQKEWFLAGYDEMLRRIKPERIVCYNTPFPEIQGDIIYVDYDRRSWKFMKYNRTGEDLEAYKIGGQTMPEGDTIAPYLLGESKGGGSAYGGKWRPNPDKPENAHYLGEPGEVKTTVMRNGNIYRTKIGPDGRAIRERHETDHGQPRKHSDPHDHEIRWENPDEHPVPGSPINYEGDAPEFKSLGGYFMGEIIYASSDSMRFTSISDFKWCMSRGGEVQFEWQGILYSAFGCLPPSEGKESRMLICRSGSVEVNLQTEKWCDTADEVLEYMVGEDRLRDVITKVTVLERTI